MFSGMFALRVHDLIDMKEPGRLKLNKGNKILSDVVRIFTHT